MMTLFSLFGWHFLADFPLQGDFLSRAKNPNTAIQGIAWWYALLAHASIHGFGVMLITGSISLGIIETVFHFSIDCLKCAGKTSFLFDQFLHLACKVLIWVIYLVSVVHGETPGGEGGAEALWRHTLA